MDYAKDNFIRACERLRALEQGRFAYLRQAWVGSTEARDYDQRLVAARVIRDQALQEYRLARQAQATTRPVRL
jgi:hypothetical protein